MTEAQLSRGALLKVVLSRYIMAFLALAAMFFIPAGTLAYWNALLYLGIIFIPMGFVMLYLLKYDPALLERRMRFRERQGAQKRVIGFSWIIFLLAFLIPGFDYRFGWSEVPVWVVLLSAVLMLLGYAMIFWVFRENSYASRVVEVMEGQRVIDSGPYAIVRHPMYTGLILAAFGSLLLYFTWTTLYFACFSPFMLVRAYREEKVLADEFGEQWQIYRKRVPPFFPRLKP